MSDDSLFRMKLRITSSVSMWHSAFLGQYSNKISFYTIENEYWEYISPLIKGKELNKDIIGWLLSDVYKNVNRLIKTEREWCNGEILKLVDNAFRYTFAQIQKEWKHGVFHPLRDYYVRLVRSTFETARGILSSHKSTNNIGAHYNYIGYKAIELILLYKKYSIAFAEEEERRHLREEAQALKELKREKEQAEKDAEKARKAIEKNEAALVKAKNEEQTQKLLAQIEELKAALAKAEERQERAVSMAQQTRCGYVYVISNIGSFGEGVYKIGMTRRVNPIDRVHELGDASVPFRFDVHAMIYTEDAPGLESALHRKFHHRRVNLDNYRKEYFRVSLDEVRAEVERMGIVTTWVETPKAEQWRSSERQRNGETSVSDDWEYEYNPFEDTLD